MRSSRPIILCVDDEPQVLNGLRLTLRRGYELLLAESGEEALAFLAEHEVAVVLSDMRMPGMSGAELLADVQRTHPDVVRMLLTGHADVDQAADAVNRGGIFRFLTKPCPPEELRQAVDEAVDHHQTQAMERELLRTTVLGAIEMLSDVLEVAHPIAFARASRVRELCGLLMEHFQIAERWPLLAAASISQIGTVALPRDLVGRVALGKELAPAEVWEWKSHPETGRRIVARIPRLEPVAEIIGGQLDGGATIADSKLKYAARLLRAALRFDANRSAGYEPEEAIARMRDERPPHGRELLEALAELEVEASTRVRSLAARDLAGGMVLDEDIYTTEKVILVTKGSPVTPVLAARLQRFAESGRILEPIRVLLPVGSG